MADVLRGERVERAPDGEEDQQRAADLRGRVLPQRGRLRERHDDGPQRPGGEGQLRVPGAGEQDLQIRSRNAHVHACWYVVTFYRYPFGIGKYSKFFQ